MSQGSLRLDIVISATLAGAASICYVHPEKFPAVFFTLAALGVLFHRLLLSGATRLAVGYISETMADTVDIICDEKRSHPLLGRGTILIRAHLRAEIKGAIVEAMKDEEFQNEILATTSTAIIKATEDDGLRHVLTSVAKQGVCEALSDQGFMKGITKSLLSTMEFASQDIELRETFLSLITESVSGALQDEGFISVFKGAIKDCLRDGDIYRASASGLLGALSPMGRKKKGAAAS